MELAGTFASEGQSVVPYLKSKLAAAQDDLTIRDLVMVFKQMNILKTYDVAHDQELMILLKSKSLTMKDEKWKSIVENMISGIG